MWGEIKVVYDKTKTLRIERWWERVFKSYFKAGKQFGEEETNIMKFSKLS